MGVGGSGPDGWSKALVRIGSSRNFVMTIWELQNWGNGYGSMWYVEKSALAEEVPPGLTPYSMRLTMWGIGMSTNHFQEEGILP